MRGSRNCGTCDWFEDRTEEAEARYATSKWQGMCHWRMPATVAKDSTGWGDWHQKSSAGVRKDDWCSCWQAAREINIDGKAQGKLSNPNPLLLASTSTADS